jgi:hypothetical protein
MRPQKHVPLAILAILALLLAFTASMGLLGDRLASTEEARPAPKEEPPAFDRQINLVYTANNLAYTDTCG